MAHECPECGQVCYCNGDIDDMEMHGTEEELNCNHCLNELMDSDPNDIFPDQE